MTPRQLLAISILMCTSPIAYAAEKSKLEVYGDIAQYGIPLTAGLITAIHMDGEGMMQLAEGAFWTAAATEALKLSVDAQRPNGGSQSFPSGHTSAASQGAAYLQFRYGSTYGIPAYAAAALVGYSRVDANKHYWRDVAAGMALATGIQYAITVGGISATNLVLVPYFDGDETGIYASLSF
ncbi:phosphatase PAP2 family protein [Vibrio metoecus]|uniref:phosphatase PAP2 family protein n=1 Tax=Vibrio metoecus TaxID=1481663 RepID=UPI0005114BF1|nr:phosphatase PAP2 family protein [Vibrio metoecus]